MRENNHEIAVKLRRIAALLKDQQANPFRINAYRHAADTLDALPTDVSRILDENGIKGLVALPAIGEGIARSIYEYVATGRISRLENLQGSNHPEAWLGRIPTIGPALAAKIHDELHVDSLETLEQVLNDGRLARLDGLGAKRVAAIEDWLQAHLQRQRRPRRQGFERPAVATILRVDADYLDASAAGRLPKIAPRRFNPKHRAWLPILHANRGGWHFTALFSNTARAHQLQRTDDWVVVYYYDDHHREGQNTVVTETHGDLAGKRVVRGREDECREYYAAGPGGR